jgi:small-conductance mechanosensitive channel
MFSPMLLYLRFGTLERPGFGMWLPLFLVWLILLPIVVLVLVVTMLVDVVLFLAGQSYHHYALLLFRCLGVLEATRGTVVRVHSDKTIVDIDLV